MAEKNPNRILESTVKYVEAEKRGEKTGAIIMEIGEELAMGEWTSSDLLKFAEECEGIIDIAVLKMFKVTATALKENEDIGLKARSFFEALGSSKKEEALELFETGFASKMRELGAEPIIGDQLENMKRMIKEDCRMGLKRYEVSDRGFYGFEFDDLYGAKCSIQESSLADDQAIWFGRNKGLHHHVTGDCLARMHLNQEQVKELIPILQHFLETGKLPTEIKE